VVERRRREFTRREFVGLAAGAVVGLGACRDGTDEDAEPVAPTSTLPTTTETTTAANPFTLGVASGDPDHTSVLLWTHLDRPSTTPVELEVEVAGGPGFEEVVTSRRLLARPEHAMTARVVVDGLDPDTAYWYRFVHDGHRSRRGRTRTAPAPGRMPAEPVEIGHLSCMRYSSGYWTALDDLAALAPDLVVHCGDYVYESDNGDVRPVEARAARDLDGYRQVWRRYKAEESLQAAHAVAPWLVVWDDHEVEDNYQGRTSGDDDGGDDGERDFLDRRAAAYRAWWEFTPTRIEPPDGAYLRIHRTVDWGRLARFVLLDTRQYRDDQPCGDDIGARCDATAEVSMLGAEQEAWFADRATGHGAVWTPVVQQVVVHQWRTLPGNAAWNLDQWDGYTGARDRFVDVLAGAPDPVVLTGDVHSSWVSDLLVDFDDEDSASVGVEFVGPGVSSKPPDQLRAARGVVELASPHIAWSEAGHRGWVRHSVSEDRWATEYRLVEDADQPDTPVEVATTWTVRPGERRVG
jgi:alkaline phosphatase D